jgi:Ca-activated chloride channel family protein
MRGRIIVVLLALVAVAISYGTREQAGAEHAATAAPGDLRLQFVYSPEKETLMRSLVDRFNARRPVVDGRPVFVVGTVMSSGDAEQRIAHGRLRPTVWSPASSLWGRLLNFDADQTWAPSDSPSLIRTPLVIAMWEPMARALGWPDRSIGFADLLRLARSRKGWAAYGHPEFGPFRLVHTNPDYSTAGLSAVAAEYLTATGKRTGLTKRDVTSSRARLACARWSDRSCTTAARPCGCRTRCARRARGTPARSRWRRPRCWTSTMGGAAGNPGSSRCIRPRARSSPTTR